MLHIITSFPGLPRLQFVILAYCKQSKIEPGRPGNEASILRYELNPFNFQEERAKTQAQLKWKPFSEL